MNISECLLRDRPVFHAGGTARWDALPGLLRVIQRAVREGHRTLETGCGASTVVFAAQGAHHTAISVDAGEHQRVRAYLREIGVDDSRLTTIVGWSDAVLPTLCTGERTLDVALIDGAHAFPYPAVDWHYISRMLKAGGVLLFDDIPIPASACVFRFMESDPHWRLNEILDNHAAAFTLIRVPVVQTGELTDWTKQPFNDSWDYSFAPLSYRLRQRLCRLLRSSN
jgi:hypothetical protein